MIYFSILRKTKTRKILRRYQKKVIKRIKRKKIKTDRKDSLFFV